MAASSNPAPTVTPNRGSSHHAACKRPSDPTIVRHCASDGGSRPFGRHAHGSRSGLPERDAMGWSSSACAPRNSAARGRPEGMGHVTVEGDFPAPVRPLGAPVLRQAGLDHEAARRGFRRTVVGQSTGSSARQQRRAVRSMTVMSRTRASPNTPSPFQDGVQVSRVEQAQQRVHRVGPKLTAQFGTSDGSIQWSARRSRGLRI